ncbi:helix-turn-helix domain-containing protein [Syntrophomonas palmitatica]|uniref:helix-turn-helix domain-containing protein n=1 Tax=Syntrophomonas palmitatica TaxID=402877 RepID=UPI0006D0638B|nr:helix-turn-helix transcriptional regulator [Syntrophomonas palmitatica]
MDDLNRHIEDSLKEPAFAEAWAESELAHEITRQIIALRLQRGLTQQEVASRAGTTQSVIARIENGEQNISIKTLNKIAHALKANVRIDLLPR